ncbi:hypothetical protein ABH00_18255 [Salmonella enterica]|nr:hypothetical protein [Salmonella enterica]EAY7194892.1 hypothetical protein [Salmonella enterica]
MSIRDRTTGWYFLDH